MSRPALPAILFTVVCLAGCGGIKEVPGERVAGETLTVWVAAPLEGQSTVSGKAVINGARLALDDIHGRVGKLRIVLRPIDDASVNRLEWDPGVTTTDAHDAVIDPTTIGYIGDLNSGASAVSIPILNRAGIAQISPTSTAVGLTSGASGAEPGEPEKYYPTGLRTFARVAPTDAAQAAVQVRLQRSFGCTKTYVVDDGEVDGEDIATSFDLAARSAGLDVTATQEFDRKTVNYRPLASSVVATHANCILIAAITDSNAALVTRQLAAGVPSARIFATAGMAESTYANPAQGGIPLALDPRVLITSPALGASAYPIPGRKFLTVYARRYGPPQPDAILGYEAMGLMLSAIDKATDHGKHEADRAKVVRQIFATRDRHGAVGDYSIDSNGDTSSRVYGVWTIIGGRLRFWEPISG